MGETSHEDQTGVRRLEQERHEGVGHSICTGNVDVVGLVEAVTERHFTGDVLNIKGSSSVVDERVEVTRISLDLFESLLDRLVPSNIDLDKFNGVTGFWNFLVELLDGKFALLQRTTAEKNVVFGLVRLEKRFDGFVLAFIW